jgi:hypothetical protein
MGTTNCGICTSATFVNEEGTTNHGQICASAAFWTRKQQIVIEEGTTNLCISASIFAPAEFVHENDKPRLHFCITRVFASAAFLIKEERQFVNEEGTTNHGTICVSAAREGNDKL